MLKPMEKLLKTSDGIACLVKTCETNHALSIQPTVTLLGIFFLRKENFGSHLTLPTDLHSTFIQSSPTLQTAQVAFSR